MFGNPAAAVTEVQCSPDGRVPWGHGVNAYMKPAPPVIKMVFTSASFSNLAMPVPLLTEASWVTGESIGEDSHELSASPVEMADGAIAVFRFLQRLELSYEDKGRELGAVKMLGKGLASDCSSQDNLC